MRASTDLKARFYTRLALTRKYLANPNIINPESKYIPWGNRLCFPIKMHSTANIYNHDDKTPPSTPRNIQRWSDHSIHLQQSRSGQRP